jgi:hypothetical protein
MSLLRRPGGYASFDEWHPVELYRDSRDTGVRRLTSTQPLPYSDKVTHNCDTRAQWRADQVAKAACSRSGADYLQCMQDVISLERAAAGCLHQPMYPAPAGPFRI